MLHHQNTRGILSVLVGAAAVACNAATASASVVLNLSQHSSDQTDPSHLNATFAFNVVNSMLTLSVTNLTVAPFEYRMNEIYFNATDSVDALTLLDGPDGWTVRTNTHGAGQFGRFSYGLLGGVGNNSALIDPNDTATWTFAISGNATTESFTSQLSTIPPGNMPSLISAKFVQGPGDDSSFGATITSTPIPAPAVAWVLLIGALGSRRRRRTHQFA